MAVQIREVSRDELEQQRAEILQKLGITQEELRERVLSASLAGDEYRAVDDLRAIAFLLGESDPFSSDDPSDDAD
ncbi:MAG: hypothetical protein K6T37_09080 [Acidothermus cellulolyticus]|nr:hypothetical protein [Acidothermus cellulolyticus]